MHRPTEHKRPRELVNFAALDPGALQKSGVASCTGRSVIVTCWRSNLKQSEVDRAPSWRRGSLCSWVSLAGQSVIYTYTWWMEATCFAASYGTAKHARAHLHVIFSVDVDVLVLSPFSMLHVRCYAGLCMHNLASPLARSRTM